MSAVGEACTTESSGTCATATRLLVCKNAAWAIAADCKGPDGCKQEGESIACDLSGNGVGDHCPGSSEGKVRCEPDGGANILRCRSGVLDVDYTCQSPTICAFVPDAGLTCQ